MTDSNVIFTLLKTLNEKQLRQLMQDVSLILAGMSSTATASTEEQSYQDLVPVDIPIGSSKNKESGVLHIRFPYAIGLRNTLSWRELEVTQAAQLILVQIFRESLEEDLIAGRIQPKSANLQ